MKKYISCSFFGSKKKATYICLSKNRKMKSGHNICMKCYSQVCQKQLVCTCLGKMFAGVENKSTEYYVDFLLDTIEKWNVEMNIPRLSQGGVTSSDFTKIVNATDNKNNPVALSREEMLEILEMAG